MSDYHYVLSVQINQIIKIFSFFLLKYTIFFEGLKSLVNHYYIRTCQSNFTITCHGGSVLRVNNLFKK